MTDRSQRLSFDRPLTRRRFTRATAWTGLGTAALGLALRRDDAHAAAVPQRRVHGVTVGDEGERHVAEAHLQQGGTRQQRPRATGS